MIAWTTTAADDSEDTAFMVWLYNEFKPLMFATVKKYVSNPQDQEDIIQDSLERLMKKAPLLRQKERSVLACYVVFTVKNTSINHLKKQALTRKHFVSISDPLDEPLSPGPSLDEWMILGERERTLSQVWDLLTQEEQLLLSGKYILGYSNAEIAAQLGCAPASVRMKLTRARRQAKKLMETCQGEPV